MDDLSEAEFHTQPHTPAPHESSRERTSSEAFSELFEKTVGIVFPKNIETMAEGYSHTAAADKPDSAETAGIGTGTIPFREV